MLTDKQKELAAVNHGLIYAFLKAYKLTIEDYYDLAAIGLCQACAKFDATKAKFSTLAYRCMYGSVFKEMRDAGRAKRNFRGKLFSYNTKTADDDQEFIDLLPAAENVEDRVIVEIAFAEYVSKLTDKDKQILSLLSRGYTQTQTARMMGCGQASVSRVYVKLRKHLAAD